MGVLGSGRKVYECMSCHEATGDCDSCDIAVARKGLGKCAKCLMEINSWDDEEYNRDATRIVKLCSWCLDVTEHAVVDEKKKKYQCIDCQSPTTSCENCNSTMAPFGNEKLCITCGNSHYSDWDAFIIKERK